MDKIKKVRKPVPAVLKVARRAEASKLSKFKIGFENL